MIVFETMRICFGLSKVSKRLFSTTRFVRDLICGALFDINEGSRLRSRRLLAIGDSNRW